MRRALIQVHLWLGLTIGALWALQGLTGAWLVFHREVEFAGLAVADGPMLDLDRITAAATEASGSAPLRISIVDGQGGLLAAHVEKHTVLIEAATGRIIPPPPLTAFNRTAYAFHEELLAGENGHYFIGISGLFLLSAALIGLYLAWPKGGTWRLAFAIGQWRTTRIKLYGWHRAVGLLAALAMVVVTITGVQMVFSKQIREVLAKSGAYEPPYRAKPVEALTPPRVGPAQAWAIASAQFPGASFVRATFPSAKSPVWHIRLHQPGELRAWSGATSVTIDPASGAVLDRYDAIRAPLANRLMDWAFPLHNGEALGLGGRVLMILAGLSLPFFYVTGVLAWWAKRRRKRRAAPIDGLVTQTV